mgnify:FL=1
MKNMYLHELWEKEKDYIGANICVSGWIRSHRDSKDLGFIELSDGTSMKRLQVVYDKGTEDFEEIGSIPFGSSIEVYGELVQSEGKNQSVELKAKRVKVLGKCDADYPLQPKRHTKEFLRSIAHLRPRANLFQAVFRIRSVASLAIHEYFGKNGYVYFHAPILTASDCEGAGEMFEVTTLPLDKLNGKVDYTKDFFGKRTNLTVSGQLEAETFAMAFSKVYTFGPTFRAENSNTKTHAAEFWMIEPEIAFCDLDGLMDIEEDMLKYIVSYTLEHAKDELLFLDKFQSPGLVQKLEDLVRSTFTRVTHEEVITILKNANQKWEFEPEYGEDIHKEHETYITEYFHGPVFITDWPKDIKAFYMKQNDDGKTVRAVDLEVPLSGELMGGSQREEDYDKLVTRMKELDMDLEEMKWYTDLRRYGSVVHSGFGMGFERLLIYLTGVDNIRDVIPYPRTPGNCDF